MYIIFFKQKPAYYMRISDWSSDVGSSDLAGSLANISGISGRRGWANAAILVDEEARLGKTAIEAHRLFGEDVQCTGDAVGRLVGARGAHNLNRSEDSRVGKGCVSRGSYRGFADHEKRKRCNNR